jgi:hypothetical protein
MSDVRELEMTACIDIAGTYMSEGHGRFDAVCAAMRFLNWAPQEETVSAVVREMERGAHRRRSDIFAKLRLLRQRSQGDTVD